MAIPLSQLKIETAPFVERVGDMRNFLSVLQVGADIQHFSYERIYPKKEILILTNTPSFSELFYKEKFYEVAFSEEPDAYQNGYYLTDALIDNKIRPAIKEHCLIDHGLLIVKCFSGYTEIFYFFSSLNNIGINNFYLNNIDYFENFIAAFKSQYNNEILKLRPRCTIYPDNSSDKILLNNEENFLCHGDVFHDYNVSPKEIDYLTHLKRGLTDKEIARAMNLSFRTVQKHGENLRKKTNSHTRIELLRRLVGFIQ